jgi:hypothetical protein
MIISIPARLRAGTNLLTRIPRRLRKKVANTVSNRKTVNSSGFRSLGPRKSPKAVPRAEVVTVIVTLAVVAVSDAGLKLHDAAVGRPLQLNVTGPAADPALTLNMKFAGCPAFTAALGVVAMMLTTWLTVRVKVAELFPALASPPPETERLMGAVAGALRETLKVTLICGYEEPDVTESERVQVSVASVQVHPDPAMDVAVSPCPRVVVAVTRPVEATLPTFNTCSTTVRPVSP